MISIHTLSCYPDTNLSQNPDLKETIKEIALSSGFKLKQQPNGEMDLNNYVYDFAQTMLIASEQQKEHLQTMHNIYCDVLIASIQAILVKPELPPELYKELLKSKFLAVKTYTSINSKDGYTESIEKEYSLGDTVRFNTGLGIHAIGKITKKEYHSDYVGFIYSILAEKPILQYDHILSGEMINYPVRKTSPIQNNEGITND